MKIKTIIGAIAALLLSIVLFAETPDKIYASASATKTQTPDLTPKLDTEVGKYGYVDKKGKWVIEPQFSLAAEFSEGLALVSYFIDKEGPNTGYINTKGEPAFTTRFYGGYAYKNGYAIVEGKDYKISIIDKKGKVKLKTDYYYASISTIDGIYAHIGESPSWRGDLPQKFGYITNDFTLVKPMFEGMVGYYVDNDSKERIVTGIIRKNADEHTLYLINSELKPVKLPSSFILSIKEDMILLLCGQYYAFADMKGKIYDEIYVTETKKKHKFTRAESFSEGFAVIEVKDVIKDSYNRKVPAYGYIRKDGTTFKEPIYLSANSFVGGLAAVRLVPRYYYGMGILKTDGTYLSQPQVRTHIKFDDKYAEYFVADYMYTKGEYDYVISEVKKIVKQKINDKMNDIEKIAALQKYVIDKATYGGEMDYNPTPKGLWYCHEAIGILKDGWGVCDAYARLMGLLLTEAGIENQIVVGYVGKIAEKNGHAWNLIKIGKNYYHLDATYNEEKGPFRHFLVSDNYLKSLKNGFKRIWEESDYPAATVGYFNDKPKEQKDLLY